MGESRAPARFPEALDELLEAVEAAGVHAWQWDIGTGRVTWSAGVGTTFGLPGDVRPTSYEAYLATLPAEDRATVTAAIERALRGETPDYYVEHRVNAPGRATRWVAGRGRVYRDDQGAPVRLAGVVWDITARKQNEASLARLDRQWSMVRETNRRILHATSEDELFRSACRIAVEVGGFRLAWVGMVTADGQRIEPVARCGTDVGCLDGIRIEVARSEHGLGPASCAVRDGCPCVNNDLGADRDPAPWQKNAVARGHQSVGAFPLRRRGGRVVGALSVSSEIVGTFDEEQVERMLGLADDLSYVLDLLDGERQRRAAEAAMRSSEERYRAIFEQAFEAIFIVSPSHAIVDANESACRMLGYTREETLRLRAEDVVHEDDVAHVPIRFATIAPGEVIVSERRFVRKDGGIVHGEVSTKAFLDGNFQVVVRDVTERKHVQTQLLLADRMSSLGRLASGVAHEINNPLAYVMLNLELLRGRLTNLAASAPPELLDLMTRGVSDAYEGAERMRQIVRTLTTFGRGDEELVGPVDVTGVLESAVEMAAMQLRHRARLVRRYEPVGPALANAFRLGQVLLNLLVNAADALRDGDPDNEIALCARDQGGSVIVEVRDNGAGIPLELQSRIFDPFFTTKPVGKGTGLGLAVCHAIVTTFGGSIACESAPGRGSTFRVELPRATLESVTQARRPSPSTDPGPRTAAARRDRAARARILVADDDPRVARVLATALDDHDVVVVGGGREALARCRAETFDCVLCDVMMPDLSGVDVHDELRRDGRGLERRIIFVTGGAVTDGTRAALARLSNRILEKPVAIDLLQSAVRAALDESAEPRAMVQPRA